MRHPTCDECHQAMTYMGEGPGWECHDPKCPGNRPAPGEAVKIHPKQGKPAMEKESQEMTNTKDMDALRHAIEVLKAKSGDGMVKDWQIIADAECALLRLRAAPRPAPSPFPIDFPADYMKFLEDGGWVNIPKDKLYFGYAAYLAGQKEGPAPALQGLDVDAIERRAKAATAGPWVKSCHSERGGDWWTINRGVEVDGVVTMLPGRQLFRVMATGQQGANDAALITHAREDVFALIAALRNRAPTPSETLTAPVGSHSKCEICQGKESVYESTSPDSRRIPCPAPPLTATGTATPPTQARLAGQERKIVSAACLAYAVKGNGDDQPEKDLHEAVRVYLNIPAVTAAKPSPPNPLTPKGGAPGDQEGHKP